MNLQLESHFQRLAPEILLAILTRLPDLESLDSVLKASPAAFRLFDIYGAEIFEAVLLSASGGVTHEYTCALIRIAALVRHSSLPPQVYDLISFQNLIRHESTSLRYKPPLWTLTSSKLPSDIPATVLRRLLATYRQIVCLTISCLKFYLNRFKPLRPSHLVDENFSFTSDYYGPDNQYIPSWQQNPAEKPFPVQDIGTPTWIEEQRILRAFWRVQLFHDLTAATNASLISWPENDIKRLDRMTVVDLYDIPMRNLLDWDEMYRPGAYLEHELIWSVMDYVIEDRQTIIAPNFLQIRRDWPTPTAGQQDFETVSDYTSFTYWFFYALSHDPMDDTSIYGGFCGSHTVTGSCSPLQHVSFKPFRRLGFAIWDIRRMVGYGLLDLEHGLRDDSYLLAWRSILGRDDIAEVERRNQEAYEWATKSGSDTDSGDESE